MNYFRSDTFSSDVENLLSKYRVPGLTIAIIENDEIATAAFGSECLDPPKACTPDTLFDVASCAKSLTAAAVALLIDDNTNYPNVQYDSIMSKLLPNEFVMQDSIYTEGITVDDILGHRTGMAP
jgi:CubicO group peptidase (beta-lactamase class C family)